MYESGFLTQRCDFAKNMSQLVTVVYDFISLPGNLMSEQNVSTIVDQTLITYPGVKIKVATNAKLVSQPNLEIIVPSSPSEDKVSQKSSEFEVKGISRLQL